MKTLILSTLLLATTPQVPDAPAKPALTCEQNQHDIDITDARINDIQKKFKASNDEREKMILGVEGTMMMQVRDILTDWHAKHCDEDF